MASTTLQTLYQRVARRIGRFQSTAITSAAVGPDPGRWVISVSMHHDGSPDTSWVGGFVTFGSGASGSYRIAHEEPMIGALALDQAPSVTAIPVSSLFEASWPLPVNNMTQGIVGLTTFVQEAGWEVWHEDTVDVTTVAGRYTYDLTAQRAWLDSAERVLGLYSPAVASGYPPQPDPKRYDGIAFDAGTPTLQLRAPYRQGGLTAQLRVMRPASSLVGGAESTTGPTATTDTVAADPTELVEAAVLRAYRYLAVAPHLTDQERQRYAALIEPQQALVRATVRHYLPRDEMASAGGRAA